MSKGSKDKADADIAKAEFERKHKVLQGDYDLWVKRAASAQTPEDKKHFSSLAAEKARQIEVLTTNAPK